MSSFFIGKPPKEGKTIVFSPCVKRKKSWGKILIFWAQRGKKGGREKEKVLSYPSCLTRYQSLNGRGEKENFRCSR